MEVRTKNTFTVHKADKLLSAEPVESKKLGVVKAMPQFSSLDDARELYNVDAKIIFDFLKKSIPQGTRHRLVQLLLADSENLYRGL